MMNDLANRISQDVKVCEQGPWMLPEATKVPCGDENGKVLVIGVGGSTLRLTEVSVSQNSASSRELLSTDIPLEVKKGDLFEWCVGRLMPLLDAQFPEAINRIPDICVSWSFPLLNGRILSMGKSFDAKFASKNLVEVFNNAFDGKYEVKSATNDGTSSLVAGLYSSPNCLLALTLGTGVNINLLNDDGILVNTETSMLGREDTTPGIKLPCKSWDITDPISEFQPLEVQVGGLYLGQMLSRASGQNISTPELWKILKARSHPLYDIANFIVTRASYLVASAIVGLLVGQAKRTVRSMSPVEIAYTGGVIFEREFIVRLEFQLKQLSDKFGLQLKLQPQKYGSEIGAAIACLAEKLHES